MLINQTFEVEFILETSNGIVSSECRQMKVCPNVGDTIELNARFYIVESRKFDIDDYSTNNQNFEEQITLRCGEK